ncbi:hypothetical protein [Klebsiella pneumoniae ISC21]|nr:hypothetical protein [Klebsiella pneumoniae ISC21]
MSAAENSSAKKVARAGVNVIQHFIHQIIRQMAGVNPGEAAGGVLGGGVILAGGEGDEL